MHIEIPFLLLHFASLLPAQPIFHLHSNLRPEAIVRGDRRQSSLTALLGVGVPGVSLATVLSPVGLSGPLLPTQEPRGPLTYTPWMRVTWEGGEGRTL